MRWAGRSPCLRRAVCARCALWRRQLRGRRHRQHRARQRVRHGRGWRMRPRHQHARRCRGARRGRTARRILHRVGAWPGASRGIGPAPRIVRAARVAGRCGWLWYSLPLPSAQHPSTTTTMTTTKTMLRGRCCCAQQLCHYHPSIMPDLCAAGHRTAGLPLCCGVVDLLCWSKNFLSTTASGTGIK